MVENDTKSDKEKNEATSVNCSPNQAKEIQKLKNTSWDSLLALADFEVENFNKGAEQALENSEPLKQAYALNQFGITETIIQGYAKAKNVNFMPKQTFERIINLKACGVPNFDKIVESIAEGLNQHQPSTVYPEIQRNLTLWKRKNKTVANNSYVFIC